MSLALEPVLVVVDNLRHCCLYPESPETSSVGGGSSFAVGVANCVLLSWGKRSMLGPVSLPEGEKSSMDAPITIVEGRSPDLQ